MQVESTTGWSLTVAGAYPENGTVTLTTTGFGHRRLALRIPAWSGHTIVRVGDTVRTPAPGGYVLLEQPDGTPITVQLDFAPSLLAGGDGWSGRSTVYYGPILYGYDSSLGGQWPLDDLPPINRTELETVRPVRQADGRLTVTLSNGLILCDFYHMGITGCDYTTWVPVV